MAKVKIMSQPENRNQNTMYIDQWYGDTEVTCVCFYLSRAHDILSRAHELLI